MIRIDRKDLTPAEEKLLKDVLKRAGVAGTPMEETLLKDVLKRAGVAQNGPTTSRSPQSFITLFWNVP